MIEMSSAHIKSGLLVLRVFSTPTKRSSACTKSWPAPLKSWSMNRAGIWPLVAESALLLES